MYPVIFIFRGAIESCAFRRRNTFQCIPLYLFSGEQSNPAPLIDSTVRQELPDQKLNYRIPFESNSLSPIDFITNLTFCFVHQSFSSTHVISSNSRRVLFHALLSDKPISAIWTLPDKGEDSDRTCEFVNRNAV